MKNILYICGIIFLFASCKKEKIVAKIEENNTIIKTDTVVVSGNTIPKDSSISELLVESYINRAFIVLLGRKPSASELSQANAAVSVNNFSIAHRKTLIDQIYTHQTEYISRWYDAESKKLLVNIDSSDINQEIFVFNFLLSDTTYQQYWPALQIELTRVEELKNTLPDLLSHTISFSEAHKRLINNKFYDDLNMGSQNFVISSFQHFFDRYPTTAELQEGVKMVDKFNGILFFQQGNTKDAYLQIFFNCDNYYEGQVKELYLKYLFRNPNTVELSTLTNTYSTNKNLFEIQKELLSTNEFAGVK